jgi:hypothetical protein
MMSIAMLLSLGHKNEQAGHSTLRTTLLKQSIEVIRPMHLLMFKILIPPEQRTEHQHDAAIAPTQIRQAV